MEPIKIEQITFEIIDDPREKTELDRILDEERDKAARKFVENLNIRFFQQISQGLRTGQQVTFIDSDGSRYIIKNDSVKVLGEDGTDFVENENGKHICPNCKRVVDKLRVSFDNLLLSSAIKAFEYAVKNSQQYVQINQLGLNPRQYSTMNRLVKFGLAFRNDEIKINGSNLGVYGIPRKRIFDFLNGNWTVAESFLQDPTLPEGHENRRVMSEKRITIDQVPSVSKLREKLGDKLTSYEWTEPDDFISEECFE